jgi:hypothetical protein
MLNGAEIEHLDIVITDDGVYLTYLQYKPNPLKSSIIFGNIESISKFELSERKLFLMQTGKDTG